ncbi:unnamed protein product [Rhodiola kirilowii]
MAPSRRKSKAPSAAAVAARQKWKVGDLVLAKVKGFPAWPAMVSEPEKWGYKPDSKKVLVFFFGTKQIAFCSHLDVEPFTEEKKQSIQGKRYGKSANFVRAVQEIIESYDEMKMHAQNDVLNSGAEITVTNGEDSVGLLFNSETKDQMHDTPELLIPKQNGSVSMKDKLEASRLLEGEKQTDMTVISGTPLESSFVLRKKPEGMSSLVDVNLGMARSARRSRTSRIDVSKQRDSESPSESIVAGTRNIESSALCNGSLRKTNPGISAQGDEKHVDLFRLVTNFSHECNANRIASPEFRSINMTEGNSMDSTCVPEHTEAAGNLSENVGLTKKHDLDIKAVFVKKKRIRNSKRFATDSQEMTSVEKVADLVFGAHNRRLKSPNACQKSDESPPNVEGDEYLPLVKRARVRMSKLSDAKGHVDTLMLDVDEKPTNGCPLNIPNGLSLNSLNNYSSKEHDLNLMKESTGGGSVAKIGFTISANEGQPDNFCMSFPCDSVDGEAGLPPSNLLYRDSEAMSVTAPEDSQSCAEEQLLKSSAILLSSISSTTGAAAPITICDAGKDLLETNVNVACNNDMEVDVSTNTASMNPACIQESEIPSTNTAEFNQCSGSSPAKEEAGPSYAVHNDLGVKCFSLDTNDQNECHLNNLISGDQSLQFNETRSSDSNQGIAEPPDHKLNSSDSTEISECMVRKDDDDMSKIKHDPDICYEDENLQLPKMPAHSMSALDGELKVDASLKSGPSIEVEDTQHDLSHLATASGEKNVLGVQIITSSISGPLQPSPLSSSLRPISFTPKGSDLHNNGFVGPADKVLVKREEGTVNPDAGRNGIMGSSGKASNYVEAKGSLTSFGNALGTLTRTKDSIGRATRMAIECAKAGLAAKVVDILSRTLENESNLNRKVDLFFLVDSMMQCSRGLKGVVGGIYPSAIQAALPRLLSAAAPAGNAANENRRQCSKVLKLWLERRILPETVIRHHMRILDSFSSDSYSSDPLSRRSSRTERACHDPLREMEGMLVDEYGSNSSFQLSGFCMPRMRKDDSDGSDSDGGSFEAVTPEHNLGTPDEPEHTTRERHRHILEDVDGELEMEDVAPSEAEMDSSNDVGGISTQIAKNKANATSFSGPPLPSDVPPSSPPLPTSPPPSHTHTHPPPPLPHVPHQNHSMPAPLHPPPLIPAPYPACPPHCHSLPTASDRPLPPQPSMQPFPPSVSGCPPVFLPIPVQPSTDMIANGTDSMHYSSRNNLVHSLPPASPHTQQTYGDSMDHRASDRPNTQRQMGIPEPSTSCSFDIFTGPHHAPHPTNSHSVHPSNGIRHSDNYNARPPSLGPPNNFTSVEGDHRGHNSWREGPIRSYSNNYHRGPSRDDRRYHNDHNWRKPGSQELYDDRRYYGPPFVGEKGGGPYPPHPYAGPSDEHNRGRQGWGYPPREMHHRNSMSVRPEDPRYWRQ